LEEAMRLIGALAVMMVAGTAFGAENPETEKRNTLYAIGATVAKQLTVFNLTAEELDHVLQGIKETQTGVKSAVDLTAYNQKIQELARARRKQQGEKSAPANREFQEKAAREPGAKTTPSGMVYIPVAEGKGDGPKASDTVRVNYRGTLVDGREFDSSFKRGKPLEFKLDSVIKCWTEGLQMMRPGGKAKLVCPSAIAYGENGAGEMILPGATLAFEVELLEIVKGGATPAKPAVPAKK
jgi:FKBP-type peptidyl-prolyl cis-trans isomerase FkpA